MSQQQTTSTSATDPARIVRKVALKLLDHATDPHMNAEQMLSVAEQTVQIAQAELKEKRDELETRS